MSNKRNELCSCGSNKKRKKCCGFIEQQQKQLKSRVLRVGPLQAAKELGGLSNRLFKGASVKPISQKVTQGEEKSS
jgi:hypothetical protein